MLYSSILLTGLLGEHKLTQATLSRFHSSLCRLSCRPIRTCSLSAIFWTTPSTFGNSSITRWRHTAVLLHSKHKKQNFFWEFPRIRTGRSAPAEYLSIITFFTDRKCFKCSTWHTHPAVFSLLLRDKTSSHNYVFYIQGWQIPSFFSFEIRFQIFLNFKVGKAQFCIINISLIFNFPALWGILNSWSLAQIGSNKG